VIEFPIPRSMMDNVYFSMKNEIYHSLQDNGVVFEVDYSDSFNPKLRIDMTEQEFLLFLLRWL
jgi:hypothetical protein